ncbi:MAG TPA: glycosyl hydrolase, partial [Planctomycetota bacterium]|nr:glycosyl hydrolase [Planctomycetota bacterium]
PREDASGTPLKWNWDTPLLLSAHARTRLYVAANRLFRSDDRGDSWRAISGDLTRGIDRDALEVMGRVQDVDAVAKDSSTSFYGNCTALAESPLDENLLWVGTDDGLVHVTEDGGANWTRIDTFPGVPDRTYVSRLTASFHRRDRVYAAFDNHKNGDFTPYLLVSEDRGRTWRSIRADLGPRDIVYAIVEDDEDEDLLFCGTEFGVYASLDRGRRWIELTGNMPTIQVRDLEIQRREDDLIVGTFGRGIYVLDDYSPLRTLSAETCAAPAHLFTPRPAPLYVPGNRLGLNTGLGTQGSLYFAAPNPPFGAIVTYWLAEKPMTRREKREDAQRKAREAGTTIPYPTYEELRAEDEEVAPVVYLTVRDAHGAVVRRVECPRAAGLHRVAWDLRWPKATRTELHPPGEGNPWSPPDAGPLVPPGEYQITLDLLANGETRQLAGPVPCRVVPLGLQSLPAADPAALLAFQNEAVTLRRAVRAAIESADDLETRLAHARLAVREAPRADLALLGRLGDMARAVDEILIALRGDLTLIRRNRPSPPSIASRVEAAASSTMYSTAAPTATAREDLRIAAEAFTAVHARLRALLTEDWPAVEAALEAAGAPTTPGRLPAWR